MSDSKAWSVPIVGVFSVLMLLGVGSYVYDEKAKEEQRPQVVKTVVYSEEARVAIALARANWTLDCIAKARENSVWKDSPDHLEKCTASAAKIYYIQELPDAN